MNILLMARDKVRRMRGFYPAREAADPDARAAMIASGEGDVWMRNMSDAQTWRLVRGMAQLYGKGWALDCEALTYGATMARRNSK